MSLADKLATIAENEQRVYDAGRQAYETDFWDKYQDFGKQNNYASMFAGRGWTTDTFKPKYDIKPTAVTSMFNTALLLTIDLKEYLESLGISFDLSAATDAGNSTFAYSGLYRVPEINTTMSPQFINTFRNCFNLHTIDKLILKDDGTQTFTTAFYGCSKLENIVIEGVIGQKGFDVSACTLLTHDSLMSIINALGNVSTATTCTLGTTNLNKLTDAEKAIATEKGWTLV